MQNMTIRTVAKENNVKLWQIAERLKISEPTMTRKLRHELSKEESQKLLTIIFEIAEECENNAENQN